jgi:hypothetical protein
VGFVTLLPPRPLSAFLVNVFFKHATSYYYYVDRRWVDDLLDEFHARPNQLSSKDVTAACIVLMVLAIGTQYVHLESPRQKGGDRPQHPASADAPANWEADLGSTFYRQVARSLSEVIHAGTMLSVQVFLLLGLYSLPIDASGLGYIYLNLAIKVAIQNGMHRNVSRGVFNATTKQIRRCVWWTAYCMERFVTPAKRWGLGADSFAFPERSEYIMADLHQLHDPMSTRIYPRALMRTNLSTLNLMPRDC